MPMEACECSSENKARSFSENSHSFEKIEAFYLYHPIHRHYIITDMEIAAENYNKNGVFPLPYQTKAHKARHKHFPCVDPMLCRCTLLCDARWRDMNISRFSQ